MRRVVSLGIFVPALAMLASGCATKNWVKEHVFKREAEIDQRVEQKVGKVETRLGEESERVTKETQRLDGRVSTVETSVGQVGESAKQAQSRAEAAATRADEVDGRLTRLWSNRNKRTVVETVHVQFGFDKWELTDGAQTALLGIVRELKQNPNLTVDLEGYTDPTGPRHYNVGLSQRRVEAVRRYLVSQGAELPRIYSVGLGPLNDKEQAAKQRRVTVKLMVSE